MIQSRRLLAQGYILILLCTVSSETELFRQRFDQVLQHLFCCVFLSKLLQFPVSTHIVHAAHLQGQQPCREALNVRLQSHEYNGARRNLGTNPGNKKSSLLSTEREMFCNEKAMKREFMLRGSFNSSLCFRDHPRVEEYEKAISSGCFVVFFVNESLANHSEGAGYGYQIA